MELLTRMLQRSEVQPALGDGAYIMPLCSYVLSVQITNKVSVSFLSCGRIGSLPGGTFAASALFLGSRKDLMILGLFNKDSISRGDLCCL